MDIITFINSQEPVVGWTAEKRQAFLDDFVDYFRYNSEIDGNKKDFANAKIAENIRVIVNIARQRRAEDEIVIDDGSII